MKFNLLDKDYNLDELYYNIQKFEALNGRYPKYLIMNEQTLSLIERHDNYRVGKDVYFKHNRRCIGAIFGISIAYNEGLNFGTVDVV